MYDILDFGDMINDKGRMDAYINALRTVVESDSVVLDIGTGTGIFSLMACKFGARKVYAIEPLDTIQLAKDLAQENNYFKYITFYQGDSRKIELPEMANIIISDLRGRLPLFEQNIPTVIDARKRFLAPSGTLIASQDTLWAALVEAPEMYRRFTGPWNGDELGINMKSALSFVTSTWWTSDECDKGMVAEPICWATINYYTIESPDITGDLTWKIDQGALVHGIRVWFDTVLIKNIGFSNAPDQIRHIYRSMFFPWPEPVNLEKGDTVSITLQADLVSDEYVWRWNTRVDIDGDPKKVRAEFKQTSFNGNPLSISDLQKRAAGYRPILNDDGLIDLHIMNMMEQGLILEDMSHRIVEQFPERFRDLSQALAYVGELSIKYSH